MYSIFGRHERCAIAPHRLGATMTMPSQWNEETHDRAVARTYEVETLYRWALSGEIRVPSFQRAFKWTGEDVRLLFDSILRGYPIGTILLWRQPATDETVKWGPVAVKSQAQEALWVIDGQQRLTALIATLHKLTQKDSMFTMEANISDEKDDDTDLLVRAAPRRRSAASPTPSWMPFQELFELEHLVQWGAEHEFTSERLARAASIAKSIRQYSIPTYIVDSPKKQDAVEVFDRLNTAGKPLKKHEIINALSSINQDAPLSSQRVDPLYQLACKVFDETSFGLLEEEQVTACYLAISNPTGMQSKHMFRDNKDTGDPQFLMRTQKALEKTCRFLMEECRIPHLLLLPYRYPLPVLTRLFDECGDLSPWQRTVLRRWLWQSFAYGQNVVPGGPGNATRKFIQCIDPHSDPDSNVSSLLRALNTSVTPDFQLGSTAGKSSTWKIALTSLLTQPHLFNTTDEDPAKATRDALSDNNSLKNLSCQLIDQKQLRGSDTTSQKGPDLNSPGNRVITFAPKEELQEIFQRSPQRVFYTPEIKKAWEEDAFTEVVKLRFNYVANTTREFLEKMMEIDALQEPSLDRALGIRTGNNVEQR